MKRIIGNALFGIAAIIALLGAVTVVLVAATALAIVEFFQLGAQSIRRIAGHSL